MNIKEEKSNLVILAENHNPTVLLGDFLIKSKIIKNSDEIEGEKSVVTPGFAKVHLKSGRVIQITDDRLIIESDWGEEPFKMGTRYCKSLPHIPYRAIGINLIFKIENYEPEDLFPDCKLKESGINSITTSFGHSNGQICKVSISKTGNSKKETDFKFNYDYRTPKDKVVKLGDLHINLESERIKTLINPRIL